MEVSDWLVELGGVASRGTLVRLASRREVDHALDAGRIVRLGRGRYGLSGLDEAVALAVTLGGVLSHTSAAQHYGWAVVEVPDKPHITVSRGRRRHPRSSQAHVHVAELGSDQVRGHVTDPFTTLEKCLRTLPFGHGLAVADSALREGFGSMNMERLAELAGPGSAGARRVVAHASPLAANPFESALRAICIDVPGLSVRPQVQIVEGSFRVRPDLVDERLRVVLEADSFTWHGGRDQLASDARRYNRLVVNGWIVLRFSWEDVMFHPAQVREVLIEAVALAQILSKGARHGSPAA